MVKEQVRQVSQIGCGLLQPGAGGPLLFHGVGKSGNSNRADERRFRSLEVEQLWAAGDGIFRPWMVDGIFRRCYNVGI